ncbi:MAG: ATP-binding protein [Firmicutes bacterium]|nr:ATP-binding protein [Bacillota bacterium]
METFSLTPRNTYIRKIFSLLNNENLLFILGVRRSGKSCIAKQLEKELRKKFVSDEFIFRFNFETVNSVRITAEKLIALFDENYKPERQHFIILDEITHVVDWENAINYFSKHKNCKLILFSSHKRIISKKLNAVINNQYDIIHALPLSLPEFIEFQECHEITDKDTPLKDKLYCRFKQRTYNIDEIYKYYITYGGLPVMKPEYMDLERAHVVTDGSYSAVVTHDILEIGSCNGISAITDPVLLRCVITIMAKSIGDNISANGIAKQTEEYLKRSSSTKTIESYIRALMNAHLFYIAERFDIRTGQKLKTLAKYYIVDVGFHNYITGILVEDENRILENKVFFELMRRGYTVYNGKLGRDEINLIAIDGNYRVYVQVTNDLNEQNMDTILGPLRKIRDNHPKLVIAFDQETVTTDDGIIIMNALEFLMGRSRDRQQ